MAKIYSGGIEIATGFKLLDEQPIADYMAVDDIIDLDNLPNQFKGMLTFVDEDDNLWMKGNTGWRIVGANAENYNYLISVASTSVLFNNVTYGKVKAYIDGNYYVTPSSQTIYVPFASAGLNRKDRIVITTGSTLLRIQGTESGTIAVAPPTPQGAVSVDVLDVDDNSINSNPSDTDGAYVSKVSQGVVFITGSGFIDYLQLPLKQHIGLRGTITEIKGLFIGTNDFYDGFDVYLTNEQPTDIIFTEDSIMQLVGGGSKILKPTETILFRYDDSSSIFYELGKESSTTDNSDTIATKIEITFADLGVTTEAEVTDAMVLAYINGLGLVKSKKEFYVVNVVEGVEPIEDINFDVVGDWVLEGITDEDSFKSFIDIPTVENFSLVNGRLKAKLPEGVIGLGLNGLGITMVYNISNIGLTELALHDNQIENFNPVISLPNTLTYLGLNGNQIVDFNTVIPLPSGLSALSILNNQISSLNSNMSLPSGLSALSILNNQISDWSLSENWANSIPNGTVIINTIGNPTSSAGTTFKSILESKGYIVNSD